MMLCQNLRWMGFFFFFLLVSAHVIIHVIPSGSNTDIFYRNYKSVLRLLCGYKINSELWCKIAKGSLINYDEFRWEWGRWNRYIYPVGQLRLWHKTQEQGRRGSPVQQRKSCHLESMPQTTDDGFQSIQDSNSGYHLDRLSTSQNENY